LVTQENSRLLDIRPSKLMPSTSWKSKLDTAVTIGGSPLTPEPAGSWCYGYDRTDGSPMKSDVGYAERLNSVSPRWRTWLYGVHGQSSYSDAIAAISRYSSSRPGHLGSCICVSVTEDAILDPRPVAEKAQPPLILPHSHILLTWGRAAMLGLG
jgi:hypothetical protein